MSEHKRLRALKKLCEIIERETGFTVYRGRQVVGDDIPMPFIVINEAIRSGDTYQTEHQIMRNDRVDFLLSGYIDSRNIKHPIDVAYDLILKVEKALNRIHAVKKSNGMPLYPDDYLLGNLVTKFNYEAPVCHNPPDEVQSRTYFYFYLNYHIAYNGLAPDEA